MFTIVSRCIRPFAFLILAGLLAVTTAFAQTPEAKKQPERGASQKIEKSQNRISPATVKLPDVIYDLSQLPAPVRKMRDWIVQAAKTGDLNSFTAILKRNKATLSFSFGDETDPIAYWRQSSADGTGRDILAHMVQVFSSGFVRLDPGTENEAYIWPYHFSYPLDQLTPAQEVELYQLITPEDRKGMIDAGGYIGFRGGISADGAWQFFVAGD